MGGVHLRRRSRRENLIARHGGSTMNHRVIDHNREKIHNRLYHDYFSNTPTYTYTETQFTSCQIYFCWCLLVFVPKEIQSVLSRFI